MSNKPKLEDVQEMVLNFYTNNRKSCDDSFFLAEDKEIESIYDDIQSEMEKNTIFTHISLIIITANKYEKNILHQKAVQLVPQRIKRMEVDLNSICKVYNNLFVYSFTLNGYQVLHIHPNVTGSYTLGGVSDVIKWISMNEYLLPTAIISFGICFGTNEAENQLGDVIISKKVYPYFIGAKIKGETLKVVDDNIFRINSVLQNRIQNLLNNNMFNNLNFNVLFANYITGEAVVSSRVWRNKFIRTTTQDVLAGDMEGYGLFKECNSKNFYIPCLVLKSISDWGIGKNFNINDGNLLNKLKSKIISNSHNSSNDTDYRFILGTLKDRIQAFSVCCSFEVLNILTKNKIFNIAVIDELRSRIELFNGMAITCNKVKGIVGTIIEKFRLEHTVSNYFLHRCLMIFNSEGIIRCDLQCILESNEKDECVNIDKDAIIDIER